MAINSLLGVSDLVPRGKILQVVRATDGTNRSTTSTVPVDVTGMSVTITPTKTDSTILVIASVVLSAVSAGINSNISITDSSNSALSGAERASLNQPSLALATQIGYSTPATTSATTYKLRFWVISSGTAEILNANNTGQVYAIEVGA